MLVNHWSRWNLYIRNDSLCGDVGNDDEDYYGGGGRWLPMVWSLRWLFRPLPKSFPRTDGMRYRMRLEPT